MLVSQNIIFPILITGASLNDPTTDFLRSVLSWAFLAEDVRGGGSGLVTFEGTWDDEVGLWPLF